MDTNTNIRGILRKSNGKAKMSRAAIFREIAGGGIRIRTGE
jgi:hypothetical protein